MAMHVHLLLKGSDGQGNQAPERRHRTALLITFFVFQTLPRAANIRQYIDYYLCSTLLLYLSVL
jgi:hypothetical protein